VYGVPLNHKSSKKTVFFVFQSVSRANAVSMNAASLCHCLATRRTELTLGVSGSHGGEVDSGLPCCAALWSCRWLPTFWKKHVTLMMKVVRSSETLVTTYITTIDNSGFRIVLLKDTSLLGELEICFLFYLWERPRTVKGLHVLAGLWTNRSCDEQ
jgi:hypothetical protein